MKEDHAHQRDDPARSGKPGGDRDDANLDPLVRASAAEPLTRQPPGPDVDETVREDMKNARRPDDRHSTKRP